MSPCAILSRRTIPALLRPYVRYLWTGFILALVVLGTGCSDPATLEDEPSIQFLVGTWEAESFVVTSTFDPSLSQDLIAGGATFRFIVEPSGRYQATLASNGAAGTEFGRAEVDGSTITLMRTYPEASTTSGIIIELPDGRVELTAATTYSFGTGSDEAEFVAVLARSGS